MGKAIINSNWRDTFQAWATAPLPKGAFRLLLFDRQLSSAALTCVAGSRKGVILVVVPDEATLDLVSSRLSSLLPLTGDTRQVIAMPEVATSRRMWIPENEAGRSAALETAISGQPAIFLATPQVLLAKTIAPKSFKSKSFVLKKGDVIKPADLADKLVDMDYDNEMEVHSPGEFSRRGGIFDVYSPLYEAPIRIEFFGDEIDSLRFFMPDTQRSFLDADELHAVPRGTALFAEGTRQTAIVKDFFPKNIQTVLVDPAGIEERLAAYFDQATIAAWNKLAATFTKPVELIIRPDDLAPEDSPIPSLRLSAQSLNEELSTTLEELGQGAALWHWQQLRDAIQRWCNTGYQVVACCSEAGEVDRFRQLLQEDEATRGLPIAIEQQPIGGGLLLPDSRLALLSSEELFGRRGRIRRRKQLEYRHDTAVSANVDMEEGAYVVHVTHGIAIFRGIKTIESGGDVQEVMQLEYQDGVMLYVPLEQSYLVSRYLGAGKAQPKLSRLGSASWKKAKHDAADAAHDLAAELLRIEAMRQASSGAALKPVLEWERAFANSFPYPETPDQTEAIQKVLADLENPKPMDRLLCGDVGYGKTEVAIRAAFRAVLNGRQVAVLVPTTVLAQQHYQNFRERMTEYPVKIDMVSRFRTAGENRETLERVAAGEVDILIGTHRILQKDVHFHNLGLLIIDEEQRFGVEHKQRLKGMRADMDILTMTATPIPRTLYFSLSGIRNLSTIMTAPTERLPVTTIVANYDKELIRHAINRELSRQGQVFFLYNRVKTIDKMAEVLRDLTPTARIAIAHGQMGDSELEEVMTRFVRREIDVLVCTTIIESGVDIPNVNTIIIDRADRFGLSELYQLRGRVGRQDRQAYAYMLLPPMGELASNARERLAAIRRYTHLGAGFRLAMRDLEIRGAGNILGTEQSGHIAAVGFDLYCQLLKDAVSGFAKDRQKAIKRCELIMDRVAFAVKAGGGRTAAGLSQEYIPDLNARIDCYRRLNAITDQNELTAFGEELKDRFGPLPPDAATLLEWHSLRIDATSRKVISITVMNDKLLIETPQGLLRDKSHQILRISSITLHDQMRDIRRILRTITP